MDREAMSIYRAYRNFLDGSRSCRADVKIESQWNEIVITAIEERSSRASIDSLAIERYQEAVEIA